MAITLLENADIGRGDSVLVHHASLTIAPGDIVRIAGANGTGKSTLAATILGHLPPLAGQRGNQLPQPGSTPHQRFFGFMPATVRPLPALTLSQWCHAIDSGLNLPAGTAHGLWEELGGRAIPTAALEHLSSGNLRKALAVNALATQREVLILDEPFEELDSESRSTLRRLIDQQLRGGAGVIIISHSDCGSATRTYTIADGQLTPAP